jgi:lipopolysaccharide assembly outer membrane protein LptD (OstA)
LAAPSVSRQGFSSSRRRASSNLNLPNEDSRTVDLEDSNLFALNRFSGYDRFEDSSRLTLGVDYALYRSRIFRLRSVFGQSFRIDSRPPFCPMEPAYLAGVGFCRAHDCALQGFS